MSIRTFSAKQSIHLKSIFQVPQQVLSATDSYGRSIFYNVSHDDFNFRK